MSSTKKTTYHKATPYSASRTLKRFFGNSPDTNTMTKTEMLEAAGRATAEFESKNEGWLSGKLTALYSHSLVKPVYSYNPWKQLEYVELTSKGKGVLGRDDAPEIIDTSASLSDLRTQSSSRDLTIDEIIDALPKINEKLSATGMRLKFEEVQPTK